MGQGLSASAAPEKAADESTAELVELREELSGVRSELALLRQT